MKFVVVAAKPVLSVDSANDISTGAKIIIKFDFDIPDLSLEQKFE